MARDRGFPALLTLCFHVCVFCIWAYSLAYDVMYVILEGSFTYGGRWKYLTFINTNLQTFYFGLCILNDVFGSNSKPWEDPTKRSWLQKTRDYLLASILFPLGTFVVVTFWGIYAVDRELVHPKYLDAVVPRWHNHVMHTTVIVFLLLEKYFVYHHYPRKSRGLVGTIMFATVYQVWILWIAHQSGIWVYPILEVLDWSRRLVFFIVLWIVMIIIYLLGDAFTKSVWRPIQTTKVKTDKKAD